MSNKPQKNLKILILRFSSIGDIVLTTPVVRTIKTQLKGVQLHYCTKKSYTSILSSNPYIDKIHTLDGSLNDLITELKQEQFDFIVDLHHNLRTLIIKSRLGISSKSFNKLNREKWLFVNLKVNKMPNVHIVDRYMETVKPLGVEMDTFGLDYFIPDKDEVENSWLPETHQNSYVAFAIGGQFATKKLPVKRIIEVCDRINKPVILLGGKEDVEVGEQIASFFEKREGNKPYEEGLKELGKKTIVFNACGKFNLNQSASVLKNARAVFTHDTGLMHIAAAFQKKIYSIWGNTTPYFGMYPYRTEFVVYENNKLKCRPCSKIGYKKCPKGHFKCMNDIVFDFWIP
ncbi:glycosyltransferase family 9 protein [Chondrinema litorale]|uniref:glycosyltransferase family 9 protein n=1 Tax=Chondrinema litorale TaxID=2994555 RepID=UPI0025431BC3|nr:glycosyltransferase family 9 protein [Chondrinema litorale]UZR95720.1 glycosyltransferase family 9 protein [Chondrinema litorale]